MKVACIQLSSGENYNKNFKQVIFYIYQAIKKKADLIMLDIRQPHLVPCHDPLALLVYSAQASDVTTVMVDGNILMEERQLQTLELSPILEQATHQSIELIERSQS